MSMDDAMGRNKTTDRYSISVSGRTYDRLRSAVPHGGVARFVDDIVTSALDDPAILARLVGRLSDDGVSP